MNFDEQISSFRFAVLRAMPFYGEVLLRVPIVSNTEVRTACTNGSTIEYNPAFFLRLSEGERNFVIMHEVMHIILRHPARVGKRNPVLWNTAADLIVNDWLWQMRYDFTNKGIPFEKPEIALFGLVPTRGSTESIYATLCQKNNKKRSSFRTVIIPKSWREDLQAEPSDDLLPPAQGDAAVGDGEMRQLLKSLYNKSRGTGKSMKLPFELRGALEGKRVRWDKLLRNFMTEEISDDTSYLTPERKYLHMDLIVPGYGTHRSVIEQIWAFVDCSGSISQQEMREFLFQLKSITASFRCVMNICYWDTSVNDVYRKIRSKNDIVKCLPRYSGGTDINCVYRWLRESRVSPDIMLILTDGDFGALDDAVFIPTLKQKTLLVLNNESCYSDDFKRIGKTAII